MCDPDEEHARSGILDRGYVMVEIDNPISLTVWHLRVVLTEAIRAQGHRLPAEHQARLQGALEALEDFPSPSDDPDLADLDALEVTHGAR